MKTFHSFMMICCSMALLFSCSVEREYLKARYEAGNDLTFVHFKTLPANNDPYIAIFNSLYDIDTSKLQVQYWGGQCEVANK